MKGYTQNAFTTMCDLRSKVNTVTTPPTLTWMRRSCVAGNYTFFENAYGKKVGYVIWADICKESLLDLITHKRYPGYRYEWNDGRIRLFLDIVMTSAADNKAKEDWKCFYKQSKLIAYVYKRGLVVLKRNSKKFKRLQLSQITSVG